MYRTPILISVFSIYIYSLGFLLLSTRVLFPAPAAAACEVGEELRHRPRPDPAQLAHAARGDQPEGGLQLQHRRPPPPADPGAAKGRSARGSRLLCVVFA